MFCFNIFGRLTKHIKITGFYAIAVKRFGITKIITSNIVAIEINKPIIPNLFFSLKLQKETIPNIIANIKHIKIVKSKKYNINTSLVKSQKTLVSNEQYMIRNKEIEIRDRIKLNKPLFSTIFIPSH